MPSLSIPRTPVIPSLTSRDPGLLTREDQVEIMRAAIPVYTTAERLLANFSPVYFNKLIEDVKAPRWDADIPLVMSAGKRDIDQACESLGEMPGLYDRLTEFGCENDWAFDSFGGVSIIPLRWNLLKRTYVDQMNAKDNKFKDRIERRLSLERFEGLRRLHEEAYKNNAPGSIPSQ